MGEMRIINGSGDTKLYWSKDRPEEIEAARKMFKELHDKRYLAYAVETANVKGRVLTDFDPKIEAIIMAPPMQGG